jgi:hypothetical protein
MYHHIKKKIKQLSKTQQSILLAALAVLVLITVGSAAYKMAYKSGYQDGSSAGYNFGVCVGQGNAVAESYPAQCSDDKGTHVAPLY